jgi:MoxR-like ATPase
MFPMSVLERYPDLSVDDVEKIQEAMIFFDEHIRGKNAKNVPIIKERYGDGFQGQNSDYTKEKWPSKRTFYLLKRNLVDGSGDSIIKYYPMKYTVHLALGITNWKSPFTSNALETKIKVTGIEWIHKEEDEDWLEDKDVDIWGEFSSKEKPAKTIATNKASSTQSNIDSLMKAILRRKLVILEGVPGTGKTHVFDSIKEEFDHATFLTFHPSSDYSTFVGGIRPGKNEVTKKLEFNPTKGHLLNILDKAKDGKVILWIDELNRANVPRVFGDLISLIGNKNPPELHIPNVGLEGAEQKIKLTQEQIGHLHIVGTMNTSDRSVTPLDAALRRRFNFIRLHPMTKSDLFAIESSNNEFAFKAIEEDITCFEELNQLLNENMSSDAIMGHSYLFEMSKHAKEDSKRVLLWKYSILPNIIDTLLISQNFELIKEINNIIGKNTGLKLVDSAQNGFGKGLGRMILVAEVSE